MYILLYTQEVTAMKTGKIFRSGNSQAIRILKEFQLESREVEILRRGDALVLRPIKKSWTALVNSLPKFTEDFMKSGREQPAVQQRQRAFS
jgi:antitoxin VapB